MKPKFEKAESQGGGLTSALLSPFQTLKTKIKNKKIMASAKKKQRRVLFFTEGVVATKEEREQVEAIEGNVVFRNGSNVGDLASLEPADAVAGKYSKRYEGICEIIGAKKVSKKKKAEKPAKEKDEESVL